MFVKYTVLFAEDFKGQYCGLAEAVNDLEINSVFCKNENIDIQIKLMSFKPFIIVFNSSKLGFDSVKDLARHASYQDYDPILYNIYTYGDDEDVQRLVKIGITNNVCTPYNNEIIASHLKVICDKVPVNVTRFKEIIHESISDAITDLKIGFSCVGRDYIIDCIMLLLFKRNRIISLQSEFYKVLAKKYDVTSDSVERAIRIAIENGWKKADTRVKERYFPQNCYNCKRPTNLEFISRISDIIYNDYYDYFNKIYKKLVF